jgi:hypothetical protein
MEMRQFTDGLKNLLISSDYSGARNFCHDNIRDILQGKILYKYTAIKDYSVRNLQNNQLYLNNPRSFNDPFDCWISKKQTHRRYTSEMERLRNPILRNSVMSTQQRDMFNNSDRQRENEIYSTINKIVSERTRVVCLSECHPTKVILWSHYGDYHKGMCLEYDFSCCDVTDEIFEIIMPVMYSDIHSIVEPIVGGDTVEYYKSIVLLNALSKSCEWEYENEWRLVKHYTPNDVNYEQSVPIQCLKHIYLGACVNERGNDEEDSKYNERLSFRDEIITFANNNNIPINKMGREENKYKLKVIPTASALVA